MKDKLFKKIALALLILLVIEIPLMLVVRTISVDRYELQIAHATASGKDISEIKEPILFTMAIYYYNIILGAISLIACAIYWGNKFYNFYKKNKSSRSKFNYKKFYAKSWPFILLAIFMLWTMVGCIQAGMEMEAENYIRSAKANKSEIPQRIQEIADWSPTNRMASQKENYQNAKYRAWNGCENLKDGYLSFLFYASVMLNVLMLGIDSENYKRYIIRTLTIVSLAIGFLSFLAFFSYSTFASFLTFDRAVFNNRNHFGYFISVIYIMSVCSFIKEKNLYFKFVSLINAIIYTWHIFSCDTFGAYLGILSAMIFLFISLVIRLVHYKKEVVGEFVRYAVCAVLFCIFTFSFVSTSSTTYTVKSKDVVFDYATLTMNFGGSSYKYSFCSLSEEKAKELKIQASKDVLWGKQKTKLDNKSPSFIANSFKELKDDFSSFANFFQKSEIKTDGGKSSGEEDFVSTLAGLSQDEAYQKIFDRYQKVSGETLEQFQKRQEDMQNDIKEYLKRYSKTSGEETKTELKEESTDALSSVGNGRGPTWIRSLDLMNQRPLFGWGLENILNEFYYQYNISEGRTHNLVLQLGATAGIPAVLMYLVATITIWLKVLFDAECKKYKTVQLYIIAGVYLVSTIILNVVISSVIDKLFFNGIFTVLWWALLTIVIFARNIKLRIKDFNEFEFISSAVFVSYMISSLFGNSAFYTSPYFMIFLGMLAHEALNKKKQEQ